MGKWAWLTPDSLPTTSTCYQVNVPDSIELEAAFRGCLLLLCDPANWEEIGSITPEEVAALMWETVGQAVDMTPCS